MKVTLLGCGTSSGVPTIAGDWGRCDPKNEKNSRRRASILIENRNSALLIDTSPDLRLQLLDAGIQKLDAVLFTHAHADHLHGIDDLRGINRHMRREIPIYADDHTLGEIRGRFGYALMDEGAEPASSFYKPMLAAHRISGPFQAAGLDIASFEQDHGFSTTLGFRIGAFGYSTDVVELDDAAFDVLAGIEVWIVDCLRLEPHPTHSHLEKTLRWIERLKPRRSILTHMDQSLDYGILGGMLPSGVEPGYDGMVVEL